MRRRMDKMDEMDKLDELDKLDEMDKLDSQQRVRLRRVRAPASSGKPTSDNPFPGEDTNAPIIPVDPGAGQYWVGERWGEEWAAGGCAG